MHAQYGVALLVNEYLYQACLTFVLGHKTTGEGHRYFPDLAVHILLRDAHRGNLGIGIDHARDGIVSNTLYGHLLEHTSYRHFRLTRSYVGEHDLARHIACGIDVREVRTHEIVHDDAAVVFQVSQSLQPRQVGAAAYGDEDMLRLQFDFLALGGLGRDFVAVQRHDFGSRQDLDSGFRIFVTKNADYLLIQVGQDGRHGFDDGHGHTQLVVQGGKLHTDDATAYDNHRLRQLGCC